MSELIEQAKRRRGVLKHLILQLHEGKAPEEVRQQLLSLLGRIPYNEVVEVEQELIAEGMAASEIQKLCDLHSTAMRGALDASPAKAVPPGHPVRTFQRENEALAGELALAEKLCREIRQLDPAADASEPVGHLRVRFSRLSDVHKHYARKENLLFPYLEKKGITGPPTVMWGKDDEVRGLLKAAIEVLKDPGPIRAEEAAAVVDLTLKPATDAIGEMIYKEENILFPMSLDKLTEAEWHEIAAQSAPIGFCLVEPEGEWRPSGAVPLPVGPSEPERVPFPSGSLSPEEIRLILNTIPFDLTFVGADDTVKYFTQGRERIFERNRAIIGRKVQLCHPPGSVHIVQKIVDDFRNGRADRAPFWITMGGKFIHIEYFAVRNEQGEYLGTLEVSQELTEKRALTGEQRLLTYEGKK